MKKLWQKLFGKTTNRDCGEGITLSWMGTVYRDQGRYAEALEAYQQALVIGQEVGDRTRERTILDSIGLVYHRQGQATLDQEKFFDQVFGPAAAGQ